MEESCTEGLRYRLCRSIGVLTDGHGEARVLPVQFVFHTQHVLNVDDDVLQHHVTIFQIVTPVQIANVTTDAKEGACILFGGVFILGFVFVVFSAFGFAASWLLGFLSSWLFGF